MFFVNYLSNVILTNLLLTNGVIEMAGPGGESDAGSKASSNSDSLSSSGVDLAGSFNRSFKPRIIFISSDSHQGSSYIDYDEFGTYYEYGQSKGINDYSYS